jgi:hypothetical protein
MKAFIRKVILFLLPLVVIAFPLDLWLSHYLKQVLQYPGETEVMNDIYSGKIDSEIAIYGSSRAWRHFDPSIIKNITGKNAYNFGIDAHHFWAQYLRHLEYLKHNRKPDYILLSLDVFSLEIRNDYYGLNQLLPYMLWNKNIAAYTARYKDFSKPDYYLPLVRYIGKREAIKTAWNIFLGKPQEPAIRNRGYAGADLSWNSDLEKAKADIKEKRIRYHQESVKLFLRFIQECKEMNIHLVLVCPPEYDEGQKLTVNRKEVIDYYKSIAAESNLLFLDYSDDEICRNRNYFYNSLHLNKTGAEIFTRQLLQDLQAGNLIFGHTPNCLK